MTLTLITLAGITVSIITTLGIRYIGDRKHAHAGLAAFLNAFVGLTVLVAIFTEIVGYTAVLAYSGGIGIGTYLSAKYS